MDKLRKEPFKSGGKVRYTVFDGMVLKAELLSESEADALIQRLRAEYERQRAAKEASDTPD